MASTLELLESKAIETEPLDIVVPYTTPQLTQAALQRALEFTAGVASRIRILRMQRVPFPLQLQHSPVSVEILGEQIRKIAGAMEISEIEIYLTRDPAATLLRALEPRSILVLASKHRPWRTAQERLAKTCERKGYRTALVYI